MLQRIHPREQIHTPNFIPLRRLHSLRPPHLRCPRTLRHRHPCRPVSCLRCWCCAALEPRVRPQNFRTRPAIAPPARPRWSARPAPVWTVRCSAPLPQCTRWHVCPPSRNTPSTS
uniref:(northern house mosquito) hypothetical protein n=1 Tax=Culex pipiens TaxID=7175 RepID=A0A8D8CQE9_CULPI